MFELALNLFSDPDFSGQKELLAGWSIIRSKIESQSTGVDGVTLNLFCDPSFMVKSFISVICQNFDWWDSMLFFQTPWRKKYFQYNPKRLFLEKLLVQFWNPNMEAVKKVVGSIQGEDYLAA